MKEIVIPFVSGVVQCLAPKVAKRIIAEHETDRFLKSQMALRENAPFTAEGGEHRVEIRGDSRVVLDGTYRDPRFDPKGYKLGLRGLKMVRERIIKSKIKNL